MKINDVKSHPKYWDTHKETYFNELDSLDDEIRDIVMSKPNDSCTLRFNSKVDKIVKENLKESND